MSNPLNYDMEVFSEALQLPAAERAAFLEHTCGLDLELRRRVETLLESHNLIGDFLESPSTKTLNQAGPGEKPGDYIGRFRLLQQIGEGGYGVVFMAEQEVPVRRRVALKVIKPGMDTKNVIARFEAERQALALMDHPNIAKIFDAGATESGRPYFVMELVRGVKITEYCDQHALTTGERLKLFSQVCLAVQHAHQKGVIHRDIKPSNILVITNLQGEAVPVVIDFGVAKATTQQPLTDKAVLTGAEMFIGTPAYMSPEQAALASGDVDTRTDIYSLGVLLYELLTGLTPFNAEALQEAGIDEIRRLIREQEPVRPSTRLTSMSGATLTTVAQHRRSEPPTLIHLIRGDLDWIVMKALEKDRTRRYQTAYGLSLDVQHYLADEPITARPPSRLYKFQKMVVRNKLLFTGIALLATFLVLGLIIVSTSLRKVKSEEVKSKQVTTFLEDMLNGVGPAVALGRDTTMMREILDRTAERVGTEMTNQPLVEADLRRLIGRLYQQIGNPDRSEDMYRAALAINRREFGPESRETATSLNDLGFALLAQGKRSEAEAVDEEALAIRRQILGSVNLDTATSLNDLSGMYTEDGRLKQAEAMAREALGIRQKLIPIENLQVADSLRNLSVILGDEGNWAQAEALARQVLVIRRDLLGPEHPYVASALNDLAWAASGNNKPDEAEKLEREALAMRQKLLGADNPEVANSLYLVGDRMRHRGNLNDSYPVLVAALSIQRKVLGEDNPATLGTLHSLGLTLRGEGKLADSETVLREDLAGWRTNSGNEDPQTLYALRDLGETLDEEGKWSEAEAAHREELAAWFKRSGEENTDTLYAMHCLAVTLAAEGKRPEAEALHIEAVAGWRKLAGNQDPRTLHALRDLGATLEGEGKYPEAEVAHREALAAWRKLAGDEDPETLITLDRLGFTLEREGKLTDAENVYREALAIWRRRAGDQDPQTLTDLGNLNRVLIAQQKFGEAEELLDKVLTPAFCLQPASADLLAFRADLYARRSQWQQAASDAGLALEYQPANPRYAMVTALFLKAHNLPAYERLCKRLMSAYATTSDPYDADQVAKSCLFLPSKNADLKVVGHLADIAVTNGTGDTFALPFYQDCKALAEYRLGNYSEAVEWAQKPLRIPGIYVHGHAYATLALAYWQLGAKAKAREMLAKGDALDPSIMPAKVAKDPSNAWLAWLFARLQLDEATTLIQPESTATADSTRP